MNIVDYFYNLIEWILYYTKYVEEYLDKMKCNDKLNKNWVVEIVCVE